MQWVNLTEISGVKRNQGVDQEVTEGDLDLEIEKGHQENLDQNHEKEVKIENVPEHPKKVVGVVRVLEGPVHERDQVLDPKSRRNQVDKL